MKTRTLVASELYFGLEPVMLTRGAERALDRFADAGPDNVRLSTEALGEAFQLDTVGALRLLQAFVANKLLEPDPASRNEYRVTTKFREIAAARVVPPLRREEAKQLLDQACEVAARFNADPTRNPLLIERMAVSGAYMSSNDRVAKLALWPIVGRRADAQKPAMSDAEGAREIRHALRGLSPFIAVRVVSDTAAVERPFSVPFEAGGAMDLEEDAPEPRWWEKAAEFCRGIVER